MNLKNLRYVHKESNGTKVTNISDKYVFEVSDISNGLLNLCNNNQNFLEINKNQKTITIKEPINKKLEHGIRGCCHPVDLSIDEVIDNSYKIFSHTEICNLNTYIQRSRGEILFARKWLIYEGQSEDVILPYFAKILGKDFDESGVNGIIYRDNGTAGSFVKLAKVLSIPWIILADNDRQGSRTKDEIRNCGYSEEIINKQVLLTNQQDFENELATSNRIFSDYEIIVKDRISQGTSSLKTEENIATYKDNIITLVKKDKVFNAYKLLDLWNEKPLNANDIPEIYKKAILEACE